MKRSLQFHFMMRDGERLALRLLAARLGLTSSEVLRHALHVRVRECLRLSGSAARNLGAEMRVELARFDADAVASGDPLCRRGGS